MRNPAKKFIDLIKKQESAVILKGNFSPLQNNKKIEEIKQLITFQSKRKNFPYVFFNLLFNSTKVIGASFK